MSIAACHLLWPSSQLPPDEIMWIMTSTNIQCSLEHHAHISHQASFFSLGNHTIAGICNTSFVKGMLPASQKHTIIPPRLKKPTLDPGNLLINSFRIWFFSKKPSSILWHCVSMSLPMQIAYCHYASQPSMLTSSLRQAPAISGWVELNRCVLLHVVTGD